MPVVNSVDPSGDGELSTAGNASLVHAQLGIHFIAFHIRTGHHVQQRPKELSSPYYQLMMSR